MFPDSWEREEVKESRVEGRGDEKSSHLLEERRQ